MRQGSRASETGQVIAEYALLVGGIAIVCIFAVLFLSGGIGGLFDSTAQPTSPGGPLAPPSSELSWPTTIEECEDGGWKNFAQFEDEAECKEYVEDLTP